jgi:hypothetical protein
MSLQPGTHRLDAQRLPSAQSLSDWQPCGRAASGMLASADAESAADEASAADAAPSEGGALAASAATAPASTSGGVSLDVMGEDPASLAGALQVAVCAHSGEAGPPHAQAAMLAR